MFVKGIIKMNFESMGHVWDGLSMLLAGGFGFLLGALVVTLIEQSNDRRAARRLAAARFRGRAGGLGGGKV